MSPRGYFSDFFTKINPLILNNPQNKTSNLRLVFPCPIWTNDLLDFEVITVFFCKNGYQMFNSTKTIKLHLLNVWGQFLTGSNYF